MTTEQLQPLHHDHLAALITGDLDRAARLRERFRAHDHGIAVDLLRAAAAVCLEHRFGPGAGLGAGPVDHDVLTDFMGEVRAAHRCTEPPPDYLAVEAVIRSLYGEPHLLEALDVHPRSQALYTVLCRQTSRHPWLAANPDRTIARARELAVVWLLG
ncbi:hypothetical protein GCM10009830_05080 [Glycomyces endophyticus]|uniref:HEPN domain-containing protein n=1 Tax=Glycomyces endophyticus TaxID=480996 RepID=A0ABN2FZP1_9ACTN